MKKNLHKSAAQSPRKLSLPEFKQQRKGNKQAIAIILVMVLLYLHKAVEDWKLNIANNGGFGKEDNH